MKIFFIRHAEAIDHETDTVKTDEYRFITSHGRKVTRKVTKALKEEFSDLDRIFTSPMIRAVQTAEITATMLKFEHDVEPVNELKNESTVAAIQKLLTRHSALNSIALVGHEPQMSLLVRTFSGKKDFSEFSISSVCLVEFENVKAEGTFKWYFDSKKMEFIE